MRAQRALPLASAYDPDEGPKSHVTSVGTFAEQLTDAIGHLGNVLRPPPPFDQNGYINALLDKNKIGAAQAKLLHEIRKERNKLHRPDYKPLRETVAEVLGFAHLLAEWFDQRFSSDGPAASFSELPADQPTEQPFFFRRASNISPTSDSRPSIKRPKPIALLIAGAIILIVLWALSRCGHKPPGPKITNFDTPQAEQVSTAMLNVRSGPGSKFAAIARLHSGDLLTGIGARTRMTAGFGSMCGWPTAATAM